MLPERLARRPDLTGRFLRIFGVPERLLNDLIFPVAFSKQGAENAQFSRLGKQLDTLAVVLDTESQPITVAVVVFSGETSEFALHRHRELRHRWASEPPEAA